MSALEAALGTPEHTHTMIREVMKAHMAKYEKHRADTKDHGERKPAATAVKTAATMDRKQVANVYGKREDKQAFERRLPQGCPPCLGCLN